MIEAVNRAISRADVVSSLDKNFAKKKTNQSKNEKFSKFVQKSTISSQSLTESSLTSIQTIFCDDSQRSFNILKEQLQGRSLVLETSKIKTEKTRITAALNNELSRKRKFSLRSLKSSGYLNLENRPSNRSNNSNMPMSMSPEVLISVHNLWNHYIGRMMSTCRSYQQLQARLSSCELVGAKVTILDCNKRNHIGLNGYVITVSQNCFFIATIATLRKRKRKRQRKNQNMEITTKNVTSLPPPVCIKRGNEVDNSELKTSFRVIQVLKKTTKLAFSLPTPSRPLSFSLPTSEATIPREKSTEASYADYRSTSRELEEGDNVQYEGEVEEADSNEDEPQFLIAPSQGGGEDNINKGDLVCVFHGDRWLQSTGPRNS